MPGFRSKPYCLTLIRALFMEGVLVQSLKPATFLPNCGGGGEDLSLCFRKLEGASVGANMLHSNRVETASIFGTTHLLYPVVCTHACMHIGEERYVCMRACMHVFLPLHICTRCFVRCVQLIIT